LSGGNALRGKLGHDFLAVFGSNLALLEKEVFVTSDHPHGNEDQDHANSTIAMSVTALESLVIVLQRAVI